MGSPTTPSSAEAPSFCLRHRTPCCVAAGLTHAASRERQRTRPVKFLLLPGHVVSLTGSARAFALRHFTMNSHSSGSYQPHSTRTWSGFLPRGPGMQFGPTRSPHQSAEHSTIGQAFEQSHSGAVRVQRMLHTSAGSIADQYTILGLANPEPDGIGEEVARLYSSRLSICPLGGACTDERRPQVKTSPSEVLPLRQGMQNRFFAPERSSLTTSAGLPSALD